MIYLEADIPVFENSAYGMIDEPFYVFTAFQIVEKFKSVVAPYQTLDRTTFYPWRLTMEYLTALTLNVFGDNYFGLRTPSVLMGLIALVSFFIILYKRFGLAYATIGGLVLLCDYNFLLSNRVVEPTIHRMAGLMLLVLLFNVNITNRRISGYYNFFLGCSSGAVMLIYQTNIFILPASVLLLIITSKQKMVKNLLIFFSGILLIILPTIPSMFSLENILHYSKGYHQSVPGALHEPLSIVGAKLRVNILSIGRANFLTYNGYLLPLFILSLVLFACKKMWNIVGDRKKKILYIAVFLFIVLFCMKAIPWSNGHEVDVSILLCICLLMSFGFAIFFLFNNFKNITQNEKGNKLDATMFLMLAFFFLQTIILNDFPQKKLIILLPFFLYFILWGIYELPWNVLFVYLHSIKLKTYLPLVVFLPALLISPFISYKYIYERPTYGMKEAMIKLNDFHEEVFLGYWSQTFRLYNSYEPVLNYYLQDYTYGEKMYLQRMREFGEKFYPRSVTLYFADDEGIERLKKLGYYLEQIIYKSNDPTYPDVGLYRYRRLVN